MSDYISRDAAINAVICTSPMMPSQRLSIQHAIEAISAADVRPVVRGKWIPVGLDDADEGMFKCSECGSEHFFPEILLGIPADNFCPKCGADMRPQPPKEEAG